MIITFDSDVVSAIEIGDESVLDCLDIVSQQILEGHHILFVERNVARKLSSCYFRLSKKTCAVIKRAIDKSASSYGVFKYVNKYIKLTVSENLICEEISEGRNAIVIPISRIRSASSLVSKPLFITENADDCKFYINYAKRFVDIFESYQFLRGVKIQCENSPGYGGNIWQAYEIRKTEAERVVFALTDSDQEFPSGKFGDTANNLKKAHNVEPSSPLVFYEILNVRAAENLIPKQAFIKAAELIDESVVRNVQFLLDNASNLECWPYLHVKKDLKCSEILCNTESGKYLNSFFGDVCRTSDNFTKNELILPSISKYILRKSIEVDTSLATAECYFHVENYWKDISKNIYSFFCGEQKLMNI